MVLASWCSVRTPLRALHAGKPHRSDRLVQRHQTRSHRSARRAQLLGQRVQQRPRDRPAQRRTRNDSSVAVTGTRSARSTSRRRRRDTLGAAYQEADALLLNLHQITNSSRRRLFDRNAAIDSERGDLGRRHAHRDARRHRRDRAVRRGHRCHEHHVGLGHRTDPGDRTPQGVGRTTSPHPTTVSGRGIDSRARRRHARRRAGCGRRRLAPDVHRLAGDPLCTCGRRRHRDRRSVSASCSVSIPRLAPRASPRSTP